MPIYDYICSACRHRTEVIHGINEPAPRFCPSCGAEGTLRKAISSPAILFKGSGWAKKDRAATRSPASSGSDEKAGDKAGDKSTDKPTEKGSEGSKAGDSSGDTKATGSSKSSSTSSTSTKAAD